MIYSNVINVFVIILCVYQITNNIILWNVMRTRNVPITNTWANLLHDLNN